MKKVRHSAYRAFAPIVAVMVFDFLYTLNLLSFVGEVYKPVRMAAIILVAITTLVLLVKSFLFAPKASES